MLKQRACQLGRTVKEIDDVDCTKVRSYTTVQMDETAENIAVRKRLRITGVVQGVGYRYWAKARAQELGLSGCVRNMSDGSVVLFIEGREQDIVRMIELSGSGPSNASVKSVEVENIDNSPPGEAAQPFRILL